jgi:hypothetical protein
MRRSSFSPRQGSFLTQDLSWVDFPKQDPKENPFGYSLPNNKKSCFLPKIIILGSTNEFTQKTPSSAIKDQSSEIPKSSESSDRENPPELDFDNDTGNRKHDDYCRFGTGADESEDVG